MSLVQLIFRPALAELPKSERNFDHGIHGQLLGANAPHDY